MLGHAWDPARLYARRHLARLRADPRLSAHLAADDLAGDLCRGLADLHNLSRLLYRAALVADPREQLLGAFIVQQAYVSINWGLTEALGLLLLALVLYLLAGRLIGLRRIAGLK